MSTPQAESRLTVRRGVILLAAVAAAYAVLQLVLFSLQRPLSWDEIVYLAQTAPGEAAMDWGPQRARGIVVLMAPVAVLHAPTFVVRVYAVLLSAAGLFLAFRPWLRVVGPSAAAGAAVLATSWVGLYFGMEVFPNLPAAFAGIGTAGAVASVVIRGHRRSLIGVAAGIALLAFFRPSDSVWIAAALLLGVLVVAWRDAVRVAAALFVGGTVGWAPWLVEMSLRYGGPLRALAAAKGESASGLPRDDLDQYLNLVTGPVRLIVTDPTLTYNALVALLLLAGVVAAGLAARNVTSRRLALFAAVGAAGGLTPYFVLNAGVNLRYLLPGWGLATVAIGFGLVALWRLAANRPAGAARTAAVAVVVVLAATWVTSNVVVAHRNADVAMLDQQGMYLVADELADLSGDGPCAFVSEFGFPQMAWATSCIGLELDVFGTTGQCPGATHDLRALSRDGYEVFGFARRDLPRDHPLSQWDSERSRVEGYGPWRVYTLPRRLAGTDAVPRIPRDGEASDPCPLSRAPTPDQIAPLRIGPRLPDDETTRFRQRRQPAAEEAA